jgi:hypothetical protein
MDSEARFGHKPVIHNGAWRQSNASRYIRKFQSRRSLLIWKTHGQRLDGWSNDDFSTAATPGDPETLQLKGRHVPNTQSARDQSDLDYNGKPMPPTEAVEGTYQTPEGRLIKVAPLTVEDRLTLVRWIDLGCPIDLDYDPDWPDRRGYGWMGDDNRPVLALALPRPGPNPPLARFLIGMTDYYAGLDLDSFKVVADFEVDGLPAGSDLAGKFQRIEEGVWEWKFAQAVAGLDKASLEVSVKDQQGNVTRVTRAFSVGQGQ